MFLISILLTSTKWLYKESVLENVKEMENKVSEILDEEKVVIE